jgi:hypothetical protein
VRTRGHSQPEPSVGCPLYLLSSAKRPNWHPPPRAPRVAPKARSRRTKHLSRGWMSHGDLVTPSRAYFSLPGDETRSGAQDLRRGLRHSARSNRPWSAPKDRGLSGTLASNGGEGASSVATISWYTCAHCRAKCVRRTSSRFTTNSDWLERMLICITTAICSALYTMTEIDLTQEVAHDRRKPTSSPVGWKSHPGAERSTAPTDDILA